MSRYVCLLAIPWLTPALALGQAPPVGPDKPPAPIDVPAMVAKAEPAVACILVSRSPLYRKYRLVTGNEGPGVLGDVRISEAQFGDPRLPLQIDHMSAAEKRQLQLDDPHHIPEAFGTGLIIDPKGLVLTNYHVIKDAVKVYVRWPEGRGSYADIHAADPRSDLAVLKLLTPGGKALPTIRLGNADDLRRGDPVVALNNPYVAGFVDGHASVSTGVVSNLRRRIPGREQTETSANPLYQFGLLMQTDARLALGSSGGALLDAKGECIGITTALAALAGNDVPGGFAVPVTKRIRNIIEVLRRGEEVDYGFLGVSLGSSNKSGGEALIGGVAAGSPAAFASLRRDDIVVDIDGVPIRDNQDLLLALGMCQAGDRVPITVKRGFAVTRLQATLVKNDSSALKPIATSLGKRPYVDGLRVDYMSILYAKSGGTPIPEGVLIIDVQKESKAAKLGLFTHDHITHVNNRAVNTPEAFYLELSRAAGPIALTVQRDDKTLQKNWR